MTIRDKLQKEWAEKFVGSGILHLAPRTGKCRTSIKIFEKLGKNPRILIAYPDKNIEEGWLSDIKATGYDNPNVEFVTHMSLDKKLDKYDLFVIDEIHLLSEKQKGIVLDYIRKGNRILGLSGTLSKNTQDELKTELGLKVLVYYSLEEAITDGLISDYRINIHTVDLDSTQFIYKKVKDKITKKTRFTRSEKGQYKAYTWVIQKKGQSLLLNLARMRIIHNSIAKINKTKDLLSKLKDKRVLVFCPNNKVAKELGCKIHTTKFYNQEEFDRFIEGGGNHTAVCKIGNTGVSFRSLSNILVNSFDSNSENLCQRICRSLILDEKDKISQIDIVCSKEDAEMKWLKKALEFFKSSKIKYV